MSLKKYKLTDEQMEDLKEAFHLFDRNNNGCITVEEISLILKTFGQIYAESEIREMVLLFYY
jgi:Ca2+-binding EF-hand superfamily protein